VEPLVTPDSINLSPAAVIACVVVAVVVGLIGTGTRRFLLATLDELASMGRDVGGRLVAALLRRRPGELRTEPWFCARCRSQNHAWASRCYACDARRADAEAPVPDVDAPAGPGAGRAQRRG
jgi:hypothetical protein